MKQALNTLNLQEHDDISRETFASDTNEALESLEEAAQGTEDTPVVYSSSDLEVFWCTAASQLLGLRSRFEPLWLLVWHSWVFERWLEISKTPPEQHVSPPSAIPVALELLLSALWMDFGL